MDQCLRGFAAGRPHFGRALLLAVLLSLGWLAAPAEAGEQAGLGLQVAPLSSGEVVALAVVDDSPADLAGMRPGDVILVINEIPLAGRDFRMTAREFFWNETIREFSIVYARPGVAGIQTLTLTRAQLQHDVKPLPGIEMLAPEPAGAGKGR